MNHLKNQAGSIRHTLDVVILCVLVGFLGCVAISNYREARWRTENVRAKRTVYEVGKALEAYHVDHRSYPRAVPLRNFAKDPAADTEKIPIQRGLDVMASVLEKAGGLHLMAADPGMTTAGVAGLTTPVAYLGSMPPDPCINFEGEKNIPPAYCVYNGSDPGWLLFSPGVDHDYDLQHPEEIYNPEKKLLSKRIRSLWTDPKYWNYTLNGDIINIKPEHMEKIWTWNK